MLVAMVELSQKLVNRSRICPPVPPVLEPAACRHVSLVSETVAETHVVNVCRGNLRPTSLVRMASQVEVFRIGVMFAANSCCASGVNNALSGLFSFVKESGKMFELIGIVGGPQALVRAAETMQIHSKEQCLGLCNLGGTELLGYSSFSNCDLNEVKNACMHLELTSLVIIAASDELVAAFRVADSLTGCVNVVVIPQSRNQHVYIENGLCSTSLGFDSARRILAELAGNIAVDCLASKKYWHFINCGDAALVTEVGLLIRANLIVTEADPALGTRDWIVQVADLIEERMQSGHRSGVVMVSQCAFSRTLEMAALRAAISGIETFPVADSVARKSLSKEAFQLLERLPKEIKQGLLRERDREGNPKLSYWSPEEFLVEEVKAELAKRHGAAEIAFRTHFLAHESRCPVPTDFDCILGSSLGRCAGAFVLHRKHKMLISIRDLHRDVSEWIPCGLKIDSPDTSLLDQRGYALPVPVRAALDSVAKQWRGESRYRSFGPLQLKAVLRIDSDVLPITLMAARGDDVVNALNPAMTDEDTEWTSVRTWTGASPPITLPLRRTQDMSPLEHDRREYVPKIPGYLSEPYSVVDSDICARVCSDGDLLASVFPLSAKLLPVQIVPSSSTETQDVPVGTLTSQLLLECSPGHRDVGGGNTSEEDSDGDSPPADLRIESRISMPLMQRSVLSPTNSLRTAPPVRPQLVRASDVGWHFSRINTPDEAPPTLEEVQRPVSIESIDSSENWRARVSVSKSVRVGIVFMCSQVPGCHNVVSGVFDYVTSRGGDCLGFLGGSTGLKAGWHQQLTPDLVERYRNQGGQDLLGHFGESLQSDNDFAAAVETIKQLALDGLVIVGNLEGQLAGALLTERLLEANVGTKVIAVPASAENEIPFIRQSIGCDTVTQVFSYTISNLWTESHSSRRRWYFVRLMSHHVSHLALECALHTHPNIVLVTEEVAAKKRSLAGLTEMIADCVIARSDAGKGYGIVLIPDGVAAAIPDIRRLLRELDKIVSKSRSMLSGSMTVRLELVQAQLSRFSSVIFQQLPRFVQSHLINGALRHAETGRIDIANVATERIIQSLVKAELIKRKHQHKIDLLCHSLAHQGRSSLPTAFDCDLAYTYGYTAGVLLDSARTGLVANVQYTRGTDGEYVWAVGAFPLTALVEIGDGRITISPTKLAMSGSVCRALLDSLPPPKFRHGKQSGPYQFGQAWHAELSLGNVKGWESFEALTQDCKEILMLTGSEFGHHGSVIDSVVTALENLLKSELVTREKKGTELAPPDWFLKEPDDILSTCAPTHIFSKSAARE